MSVTVENAFFRMTALFQSDGYWVLAEFFISRVGAMWFEYEHQSFILLQFIDVIADCSLSCAGEMIGFNHSLFFLLVLNLFLKCFLLLFSEGEGEEEDCNQQYCKSFHLFIVPE